MRFDELLRQTRLATYRSSRDFFVKSGIPCSYFHYTKIENGQQYPEINLAVEILKSLKIDVEYGINALICSMVSDPEAKGIFVKKLAKTSHPRTYLSDHTGTSMISPSHIPLFLKDIRIFEVYFIISSYSHYGGINKQDLMVISGHGEQALDEMIAHLRAIGVVWTNSIGNYFCAEWLTATEDVQYLKFRMKLFVRSFAKFKDQEEDEKYHMLLSRRLSDEQFLMIKRLIQAVFAQAIDLPGEGGSIRTIGLFSSTRVFGD